MRIRECWHDASGAISAIHGAESRRYLGDISQASIGALEMKMSVLDRVPGLEGLTPAQKNKVAPPT